VGPHRRHRERRRNGHHRLRAAALSALPSIGLARGGQEVFAEDRLV
jgi:hypothetical protein